MTPECATTAKTCLNLPSPPTIALNTTSRTPVISCIHDRHEKQDGADRQRSRVGLHPIDALDHLWRGLSAVGLTLRQGLIHPGALADLRAEEGVVGAGDDQ